MADPRPTSPNMQNYRPQLTSVLSFAHRLSGAALALCAFGLAGWLVAASVGPGAFTTAQAVLLSLPGQVVLLCATLALFYHLCNGIRHLIWDSVHAFELRSIYAGGWLVLAASLILTLALWAWGLA
jgi:succinate dehydrogenase / fumarate reductase cytochrome b subunit